MQVSVYGTKVCPNCDKVKSYLNIKEIPYSYSSVGEDISREELETVVSHPVRSVPVIVVDGLEKTFDQLREMTRNTELSDIPLLDLKL